MTKYLNFVQRDHKFKTYGPFLAFYDVRSWYEVSPFGIGLATAENNGRRKLTGFNIRFWRFGVGISTRGKFN